jgi:hypothetical protein
MGDDVESAEAFGERAVLIATTIGVTPNAKAVAAITRLRDAAIRAAAIRECLAVCLDVERTHALTPGDSAVHAAGHCCRELRALLEKGGG